MSEVVEQQGCPVDHTTVTGRYIVCDGKLVKISNKVGSRRFLTCTVPQGGYYSENLGTFVESRTQKRRLLDVKGLEETG